MDSILIAHVADQIEALDGSVGYDEAADMAARLLAGPRGDVLADAARRYRDGHLTQAAMRRYVRQALDRR